MTSMQNIVQFLSGMVDGTNILILSFSFCIEGLGEVFSFGASELSVET